jgi:hypothetical protein
MGLAGLTPVLMRPQHRPVLSSLWEVVSRNARNPFRTHSNTSLSYSNFSSSHKLYMERDKASTNTTGDDFFVHFWRARVFLATTIVLCWSCPFCMFWEMSELEPGELPYQVGALPTKPPIFLHLSRCLTIWKGDDLGLDFFDENSLFCVLTPRTISTNLDGILSYYICRGNRKI